MEKTQGRASGEADPPGGPLVPDASSEDIAIEDDAEAGLVKELKVKVYDQGDLEGRISEEIERLERERRIEEVNNELDGMERNLAVLEGDLRTSEESLLEAAAATDSGSTSCRRRVWQNLLEAQERIKAKKVGLEEQRTQLLAELARLRDGGVVTGFGGSERGNNENDTDDVRLGTMTAFGTRLGPGSSSGTADRDAAGFYSDYLRDQLDRNLGRQNEVRPEEEDDEPPPSKKPKVEDVHHVEEDEGSEWESSEDEASASKLRKLLHRAKATKSSKVRVDQDDGDDKAYLIRLESWQQDRRDEERLDSGYEALDGGLRVPQSLWSKLYHYQKVGVQWLWELDQQRVGGILGDEMGLGKTVQVIAFLASLSYSQKKLSRPKLGPTLIVCPTTVMHQWVREFHAWWPPFRVCILHESGSFRGSKANLIRSVATSSGILVTSYNGVSAFKELLHSAMFDHVILDEGHKIRNPDAQITVAVKMFPTAHRIILSGSPLQNNLKELWSLFDFIFPGKLGTLPVFMQQFSVPITMGGYSNASRTQVAIAYKCATVLRDTINPYLLRRMKCDVKDHIKLPPKNDQVLFCRLTEEQKQMYRDFLDGPEVKSILSGRLRVFTGLITMRKICNHPDLHSGVLEDDDDDADGGGGGHDDGQKGFGHWRRSGKMVVVEALLKLWKKQGHKVLLFTQSRHMLKILERFVKSRGYSYLKMDGTTPVASRQKLVDRFNDLRVEAADCGGEPSIFVFLLTTKVGGLGVNLTGASRVAIYDPDWNPSTDTQARERAWRIGQRKDVTIYRLLTSGTIEEKIYHRQVFKQLLINRVLKDPTQRRFFKASDLYDLFTFHDADSSSATETSSIFGGTGSEVKAVKEDHRRRGDRKSSSSSRGSWKDRPPHRHPDGAEPQKVGEDKDKLRQKARLISQKIAAMKLQRLQQQLGNEAPKGPASAQVASIGQAAARDSPIQKSSDRKRDERGRRRRSSSHARGAEFEGVRVSHLVKSGVYKGQGEDDTDSPVLSSKRQAKRQQSQDMYVLSALFKKSGVHSAVRHDVIVDGGEADYALVEVEAERVAKQAVEKLRQSRRMCFRAEAGVPTWTGANGVVIAEEAGDRQKLRFGQKKASPQGFAAPGHRTSKMVFTAKDLLARMKARKDGQLTTGSDPDHHPVDNGHADLLADIRNFLAFESPDGQTTSDQLVAHFREKLPPKQAPFFKALLKEICVFRKVPPPADAEAQGLPKARGQWCLKAEFR